MARQAVLEILADASKLKSTLGEAEGHADKFGAGIGKALAIIGGTAAVTKFGLDSVKAFTESEQAQSKLELALKNSNHTIGVHADEFAKLNTQLAKHTLADDDVIAATEAQMVTFGASKEQIVSMIPTVLDFAAKMGVTAPEAADLFDKASLGSVKALKALGIEGYKPVGDKAIDLANIQNLLRDKVKGAAQAQLDAAGPGAKIKKSMDELQESVGKLLVPALEAAAQILSSLIDWFTHLSDPVKIAIGVVGGLAVAVWAITAAQTAWTAITGALAIATGALNAVLALNPIVLVALAVAGLVAALVLAYQHCETFRNIVQAAFGIVLDVVSGVFNWVKDHWQLLLEILTGPIGIAVGIITSHWDTIKNAVMGVFDWVKDHWQLLLAILTGPIGIAVGQIVGHWDTIKNAFTGVKNWIFDRVGDIVGFITGLPGRIASAAEGMFDGIKNAFKGAINWIIGAWNSLHFGLPSIDTHIPGVGKIGGFDIGVPQIKPFATGGAINGLGIVGENGPELFAGHGTIIPNNALGGGNTYNISVTAIDPRSASDAVVSAILQYEQRNGTNWRN